MRNRGHTAARRNAGGISFRALFITLSLVSWAVLWWWSASPYARYIDHGGWADGSSFLAACRVLPAGELWIPALLYALGWLLMIAAMMLPTALPVVDIVRRMTSGEAEARRILFALVAGYAAAWLAFGLAAHLGDAALHAVAGRSPWLALNGWALGAAVLAVAGLFQFSALKYRCLEECHAPMAFVLQRWGGRSRMHDAWTVGWDHGVFCIGCCWALMLIMFVVGTANVGWMMLLAAVMAAEKNWPGGRRLRTPIGAFLLVSAAMLVLLNARLPAA
jgi:predicted metal-binding membrane protein